MTARKVHFDFDATGTDAFCGATPREGAPELELSERRKDVDCVKCLKALEVYDAQVERAEFFAANAIYTEVNAPAKADFADMIEDVASRNGLDAEDVANGFSMGWLKR